MTDTSAEPTPAKASEVQLPKSALSDLRQTRIATVFIAWVIGIFAVASLIIGIVVGVSVAHLNSQLSQLNGGVTSGNCLSQGGTDPSC